MRGLIRISLALACAVLTGCTQQDTECLARLGRKLMERSQSAGERLRGQLAGELPLAPGPVLTQDAGLKERIEARLRWDALLTDTKIEIQVTGNEVELKGTVKNDAQRRRAGDLAETTAGVQVVNDALKIEE